MSSLMGTAALMVQSDDAKAATEWAEHFQKNYRLMTDEEKTEARARLERRRSAGSVGAAENRRRAFSRRGARFIRLG